MTDVIEVEVDGVVDDRGQNHAPKWGLPVAIAAVGLLTLTVLVRVVVPGVVGGDGSAHPEAARATPTSAGVTSQDPRISAAEAALSAWGRFASTRDVADLADTFDLVGPQYRQLQTEQEGGGKATLGLSSYRVTLEAPRVRQTSADRSLVEGTIVWTGMEGTDQRYHWELELRSRAGAWRLWTVRDRPALGP